MNERKPARRGAYRRNHCTFIGVWVPADWLGPIDKIVQAEDSDRSKVLRKALAEKIAAAPKAKAA